MNRFKCLRCPYVDPPLPPDAKGGDVRIWDECGGGWSWGSKKCPSCGVIYYYPKTLIDGGSGFIPGECDDGVKLGNMNEVIA